MARHDVGAWRMHDGGRLARGGAPRARGGAGGNGRGNKAVGRAGRPLCCHGCEGVHAGRTRAVKLAARAQRWRQAGGACTKKEPGVPRCHSAVPMQNEQYGLSQGGLLRSGRNYVFALCGPLQERRRRQSADTGEASMGDGRDRIRWPLSMPSHDQWAAIPPARRPRANGKWKQWYDVREGTARTQACVGGTAAVWCGVRVW